MSVLLLLFHTQNINEFTFNPIQLGCTELSIACIIETMPASYQVGCLLSATTSTSNWFLKRYIRSTPPIAINPMEPVYVFTNYARVSPASNFYKWHC